MPSASRVSARRMTRRLIPALCFRRSAELRQSSPADQAAGEAEEGFVDVGAALVANEQTAALVQPGEGAFDDPALAAESGSVPAEATCDQRFDPACPQLAA